jgi:hypothetical protein
MELEVRDQSWVFRARQAVQERLGLGLLATRLLASETELSLFYRLGLAGDLHTLYLWLDRHRVGAHPLVRGHGAAV